ncbi:chemotaxis protein CheY [Pedobacter kyungheensis]|uniref:Chemotaxis protein CheY n=1 Tax=Pedobacter kyungheensis TaxID=1069985 RepID=A0A0C1DCW9_9SPHI|nr:LytTR family DNA-binding domain-containing protein [Pedobacter kyungheensis]KIA95496.1 chemotaxis protein CheY [Pedobacter kyungheensis]
MNCLIVDDEKLAIELIEDNLSQIPFLKHLASCRNAGEAIKVIKQQQVDLLFLDIKMPGINGLDFILSMENPPIIILITAFEQYAVEAFKLNVIDYLLKPVDFNRFFAAVSRAYDLFNLKKRPAVTEKITENYFFVNAGYSLIKIRFSEIAYVEGLKDYVKINLQNGKNVITRINLKDLTGKLPSEAFMRIHRSFIVSLDKIEAVQKYQVVVNETEIPIGESYRDGLLEYVSLRNI